MNLWCCRQSLQAVEGQRLVNPAAGSLHEHSSELFLFEGSMQEMGKQFVRPSLDVA
jgi:hypothetical protein